MTGSAERSSSIDVLVGLRQLGDRAAAESGAAASQMLIALRERLAAEMLGDTARALAVVGDDFLLTTVQAGAPRATSGKAELADSVDKLRSLRGKMLMWIEFNHLLADGSELAASGKMHLSYDAAFAAEALGAQPAGRGSFTASSEISIFCGFESRLMRSEQLLVVAHGEGLAPTPNLELPDHEALEAAVASLG
jgi:hypothetical protein